MKGEGVTNCDPKYVHFVHTCDAGYFIRIRQLFFFLRGWWTIISWDFALFSFKLLAEAQSDVCL